ncbi:MAG: alpha/beta fold hydrolase [Clostridiales bacterium]|nr:alpha/beta fold hydrolase [Clostridiales bacterium]
MEKKKHKLLKGLIITLLVTLFAVFAVILPVISCIMYGMVFGIRYETQSYLTFSTGNFPGLMRDRYEFASNEGQILTGYRYYREGQDVKGLIIMAHGIGAGHNSYMDCADYFTQNGYDVFAFDVTGNDESEGSNVRGLPQGVIDLDHAISFVEGLDEFSGLPIVLFGHSWGGYSCTSVLNQHPEVAAVCSVSGFNRSSDLLLFQGEQMIGPVINIMMPYLNIYERIKFGEYAVQTSMDGFANSDARIMIVHSEDDDTVGIQYGYDVYYGTYADDPDFVFIRYTDKGHSSILSNGGSREYMRGINEQLMQQLDGRTPTEEEREAYYSQAVDMDIMATFADTDLLGQVVAFYDEALGVN